MSLCRWIVFCLFTLLSSVCWSADDWLLISAEELKMMSEPKAPGAPAVYLYRQVDHDDLASHENLYYRIKILTEEGRKYADVEIPFLKYSGSGNIKNIQARTIHPDGRIVTFDGQIYEKITVKARGFKFLVKTFTMPDVQPGSIIEYKYSRSVPNPPVDSRWLLNEDLFTKRAKFSLRHSDGQVPRWTWPFGLPEGTEPPVEDAHGVVRMEIHDIPAFQIEDYMPPQEEMRYRVEFTYHYSFQRDPEIFWNQEGLLLNASIEAFTNKRKAMEQALSQIVSPSDTPEQKLEKIYARCQTIRNTTFEREKSQQEENREKLKEIENVENVWKRGYGDGWDISWLFLALVRAAGLDASPVLVSTRDKHLFNPVLMHLSDLNANLVLVKLNSKDLYLDPGTPFAPFGILPWYKTGIQGLRLDKNGGTWIKTTIYEASASGMNRKAAVQLDESGTLEGRVAVTFKGLSALLRRTDEHDEDETQHKKFLQDELKNAIPIPSEVELTNSPDWSSSSDTLVAEYHIKVPGWGAAAGRRTLLQAQLFGGSEKHVFEGTTRVHPIYVWYPYIDVDDVSVTLPPKWQVDSLPKAQHIDLKACTYDSAAEKKDGSLHMNRNLTVNLTLVDSKYYDTLRSFFQSVRTGDEQQVLLSVPAN
jgi:hypothetical protein